MAHLTVFTAKLLMLPIRAFGFALLASLLALKGTAAWLQDSAALLLIWFRG